MRKLTRGSVAAALAYGLALAVLLPGLAAGVAAAAENARAKVIVLPLANTTQVGGAELAERVHNALELGLAASGRAAIVSLRPTSPAVRRAVDIEKTLTPEDLEITPPADRSQAERLGRALGADLVLWGSVDEYTYDEKAKQVTVGLTIQMLDLRADKVSTIAVAGKSAPKVGFEGGEGPLMTEAIDDAVNKVVQQITGAAPGAAPKAPTAPTVRQKKDKTWQIVGALLAVAAVAALASGGGGGGAPAAVLPGQVTDAIATPTADSVELTWKLVAGATNVTSFNVYRADLGGGRSRMTRVLRSPRSRVRLTRQASGYQLLANIGRTADRYDDISVNADGSLYAYKISGVVGAVESGRVDFYNYYELQRGAPGVVEVGPDWPTAPAMPASENRLASVHLTWTANPEPFILSYVVYRSSSAAGPWDTSIGDVLAGQPTQFDDTGDVGGLVSGTTYYYAIGAVTDATGADGRIGLARQVTFVPGKPAPPSSVTAAGTVGAVVISWTASPDANVDGYRIFRNGTQIAQVGAAVTSYTDSSAQAGGTYAVASYAVSGATTVESDRITAVPSPVNPSQPPTSLTIAPTNPQVPANGASTVALVATASNASGGVPGLNIEFTLTSGGGKLVPSPGYQLAPTEPPTNTRVVVITNASGKAGVLFQAGATVGTSQVTARWTYTGLPTLTRSVTINQVTPTATTVTLVADDYLLPADGLSNTTLTATVADQGGEGVAGVSVAFESLAITIADVAPPSDTTGADGTAQTTLTSVGTETGPCTVTATVTGLDPAQVTVQFVGGARVSVSVDPSVLPAAGLGSTALITATVRYADGTPVPDGTIIRFGFDPDGQTISATGARIATGRERMLTEGGLAYSTLISATEDVTLPTALTSDIVMAWIDANDNGVYESGPSPEIKGGTVVSYTAPPNRVTLSAEPLSIPADGRSVSKIVADVRTAVVDPSGSGNVPVADGTLVEFITSSGTFMDSGASTTSGRTSGGLVTMFLRAATAQGTATVTGTAAVISGSTQVQFTAPVGIEVSVAAIPASLQANGTDTSEIMARVRDATTGDPKRGMTVQFATDIGTLSDITATTDDNGDATVTFTAGIRSGTATVVAKASGATGFVTLALTSGVPQNLSLTILAPNLVMPATNGLPSATGASPTASVYARVTDKFGNPVIDGTPVFFHTDIGQIDGSAATENGLAQAELISCNFLDATNKATYRPGWASVTAYANNPAGPVRVGPEYQIFCGDMASYNWDGSANDTDLWTAFGADWRIGSLGSAFMSQPNLSPKAGDTITVTAILADRNNNPLPTGVPLHWTFSIGGTTIAQADSTTENTISDSGVMYCWDEADVTVTKFPDQVTVATLNIDVSVPQVIVTYWPHWTIDQLVGAKGPAGAIEIVSDLGNSIQLGANPDGPFTLTAAVTDEYGNPVQDDNPVYFEIQEPNNVTEATVSFSPNPAFTRGGTAVTGITAGVLDEAQNGTFTVVAGSPQALPGSDAQGSLGMTVVPPPPVNVEVLVNYPEELAEFTKTIFVGAPEFESADNVFSLTNIGEEAVYVYVSNQPDAGTYPLRYVTFRVHSDVPPVGQGDLPLTILLDVGQQVFVDAIVDENGLLLNSTYLSTITIASTGTVTYAPATNPQRLRIVVQAPAP